MESHAQSRSTFIDLLDIRDFLEIFPFRVVLLGDGSEAHVVSRGQRPGTYVVELPSGQLRECGYQELNFVARLKNGNIFVPRIGTHALLYPKKALAGLKGLDQILPAPPLCPQHAISSLRKRIRKNLEEYTHDFEGALDRLSYFHQLFDSINNLAWPSILDLISNIHSHEDQISFMRVSAHQLEILIWNELCDISEPIKNLSRHILDVQAFFPNISLNMDIDLCARARIAWELSEHKLGLARLSYTANSDIICKEWFENELESILLKAKHSFESQLFIDITENHASSVNDIITNAAKLGVDLNIIYYSNAASECRHVDSLVLQDSILELLELESKLQTDLANEYLNIELKSCIDKQIEMAQQFILDNDFRSAEVLVNELLCLPAQSDIQSKIYELNKELKHKRSQRLLWEEKERLRKAKVALKADVNETIRFAHHKAFNPKFSTQELDDQSLRLIYLWRKNSLASPTEARDEIYTLLNANDFWTAAYWSARHAELAAILYIKQFFTNVKDASITQLESMSTAWKTHDIEASRVPFDVKNARSSYASDKNYSELCIPAFKTSRQLDDDVRILGVFSDYIHPNEISQGRNRESLILGTVTQKSLSDFQSAVLETSNGRLCFEPFKRPRTLGKFLPGWMFDHPKQFYPRRKEALVRLIQLCEELHSLDGSLDAIPIDALLLASVGGSSLAREVVSSHYSWIDPLISLCCKCGLRLPSLVAGIMAICLKEAPNTESGFRPILISDVIRETHKDDKMILGVYDPLDYISNTISVFDAIYSKNRQKIAIYDNFRLSGEGVLRGKTPNNEWETIIAYCGGWKRSPKVKCGKNPIHSGESDHCSNPDCRKLICPDCEFCSQQCPEYHKRVLDNSNENKISQLTTRESGDDIPF